MLETPIKPGCDICVFEIRDLKHALIFDAQGHEVTIETMCSEHNDLAEMYEKADKERDLFRELWQACGDCEAKCSECNMQDKCERY